MIVQLPFSIVVASLLLITVCVALPNLIMFALIIKMDEVAIARTDLGDIDDFQYVPPEYMERLFYDPKAEIYFIPKMKRWPEK